MQLPQDGLWHAATTAEVERLHIGSRTTEWPSIQSWWWWGRIQADWDGDQVRGGSGQDNMDLGSGGVCVI